MISSTIVYRRRQERFRTKEEIKTFYNHNGFVGIIVIIFSFILIDIKLSVITWQTSKSHPAWLKCTALHFYSYAIKIMIFFFLDVLNRVHILNHFSHYFKTFVQSIFSSEAVCRIYFVTASMWRRNYGPYLRQYLVSLFRVKRLFLR